MNGVVGKAETNRSGAWRVVVVVASLAAMLLVGAEGRASPACPAERDVPQVPTDPALCAALAPVVRRPSALPLDQYEVKLGDYLRNYCHRDPAAGWVADKRIRDTGPYVASYQNGKWSGTYNGTHAPVFVWYSPEMIEWLRTSRPAGGHPHPVAAPIPDGTMIIKEMYPKPAAACAGIDPTFLQPTSGAAVMIRDSAAARDGWFWGWFGWSDWAKDWPAASGNPYPNMGFGQYCVNCHASARDNQTFAALNNIKDEPGEPLVFLSQHFFMDLGAKEHHALVARGNRARSLPPETAPNPAMAALNAPASPTAAAPARPTDLPSETYDNVWVPGNGPGVSSMFVTSDQCLGCHTAGSTGLQYDMTAPATDGKVWNLSPYGTWRSSPMGLSGRDPIFYAQVASETQTYHPGSAATTENICFGCHGVLGERQFAIDRHQATGACEPFRRETVNAVPYPADDPVSRLARYGALARDGVSCMSCHRMVLGKADTEKYKSEPQNACAERRQAQLNPGLTGFASTFTGSFLVGPADTVYGPFRDPKAQPMKHALGLTPAHHTNVTSSELCGSCHTVHLPILRQGETLGRTYEQTTYPEWAFSDYRTGETPDGPLPAGQGALAQSCQSCHMPRQDAAGKPTMSKIASIQEHSNFPAAENTLPAQDIDLPVRSGVAQHTLVGLNYFLVKMAQQFPDVLGVRKQDPMMLDFGVNAVDYSEQAILDQAARRTASIGVSNVAIADRALSATVTVVNKAGHKLPSGVSFRRAFIEFGLRDEQGTLIWASGRANGAGIVVDEKGVPIAGELRWKNDCSARIDPAARIHQPHYQVVTRQDQAQIYEELVSTPASGPAPVCGPTAAPAGELTTSFLSICSKVKDNRLLPHGFLALDQRVAIASALGAGRDLAEEVAATAVGDDPDYRNGGTDTLVYRVPLADLPGKPAVVEATLYYQAIPPYYLQDRFCTARGDDTQRLSDLTRKLNLAGTPAQGWKLKLVTTGPVQVP
jgi:mono/diheme cytochrome c family protein